MNGLKTSHQAAKEAGLEYATFMKRTERMKMAPADIIGQAHMWSPEQIQRIKQAAK